MFRCRTKRGHLFKAAISVILILFWIYWWILSGIPTDQPKEIKYPGIQGRNNTLETFLEHKESAVFILEPRLSEKLKLLRIGLQKLFTLYYEEQSEIPFKIKEKNICDRYTREGRESKTGVYGVWQQVNKDIIEKGITLVTQMRPDKILILDQLLNHWSGRVSIAVYLKENQVDNFTNDVFKSENLLRRQNVDLHLVASHGEFYPVNYLRNVALNHSKTEYVFLSDVDFMPTFGAHDLLLKHLENKVLNTMQVLVVPAFEFPFKENVTSYPRNKDELIKMWGDKNIMPFHWKFKPGHGPTNYKKWKTATEPYKVTFHDAYEPYIVAKREEIPPYNQGFLGRYGNKIQHLLHVFSMGFEFKVLPDVFTIHYPHFVQWAVPYQRCCVEKINAFKKRMIEEYGRKPT